MNDNHQRRHAPPARPHPIAGYRAQHHHYTQQHLRSIINPIDQLELQRALHRNQSFSKLNDSIIRIILRFINPTQLISSLPRVSKRLNHLTKHEELWRIKLDWLNYRAPTQDLQSNDLDILPNHHFDSLFTTDQPKPQDLLGSPFDSPQTLSKSNQPYPTTINFYSTQNNSSRVLTYKDPISSRTRFINYYRYLLPYLDSLLNHSTHSLVFSIPGLSPLQRAELLATLSRLITNPYLAPPRLLNHPSLLLNLRTAADAFHAAILRQFLPAILNNDLPLMNSLAHIRHALPPGHSPHSPCTIIQTFINQRQIFSSLVSFNPLDNLRKTIGIEGEIVQGVDFQAMEQFFEYLKETIDVEGKTIGVIFPCKMGVFEIFMGRLIDETASGYVDRLFEAVKDLPGPLFLITSVQVYTRLRGLIGPATMAVASDEQAKMAEKAERIIHKMFAVHLDGYLPQEVGWVKEALVRLCSSWDEAVSGESLDRSGPGHGNALVPSDPSMSKTTILRAFKNALLLPVSVVPKTVSYSFNALSNVSAGAFHSVTHGLIIPAIAPSPSLPGPQSTDYRNAKILRHDGRPTEMESWLDDSPDQSTAIPSSSSTPIFQSLNQHPEDNHLPNLPKLRDLLSLDLVLQTITIDRQALTRLQSFLPFNPPYRQKVIDTIEQIFVLLLQSLAQNHIQPAFEKAFRMLTKTRNRSIDGGEENDEAGDQSLGDFFGLVEVADTIQQMIEVYSEQALSEIIDENDFLSRAGTEKRLFERRLDELVAHGLSLAIDQLINFLDHILISRQLTTDFLPTPSSRKVHDPFNSSPTAACSTLLSHLQSLSHSLIGRSNRQILDVFFQEIGLRFHTLLCKHIKRLTISIEGSAQLQTDLSHYTSTLHTIIPDNESLQQALSSLKLVTTLFGFIAPKDLARFIRDLVGSGLGKLGPLSPDDLYQFVQRRADWKRIQSVVDREVYGIGVEDCLIC